MNLALLYPLTVFIILRPVELGAMFSTSVLLSDYIDQGLIILMSLVW